MERSNVTEKWHSFSSFWFESTASVNADSQGSTPVTQHYDDHQTTDYSVTIKPQTASTEEHVIKGAVLMNSFLVPKGKLISPDRIY